MGRRGGRVTFAIVSWRGGREVPKHSMTVGELIDYLGEFDPDDKIVVSGYDGYHYNAITFETIEEVIE